MGNIPAPRTVRLRRASARRDQKMAGIYQAQIELRPAEAGRLRRPGRFETVGNVAAARGRGSRPATRSAADFRRPWRHSVCAPGTYRRLTSIPITAIAISPYLRQSRPMPQAASRWRHDRPFCRSSAQRLRLPATATRLTPRICSRSFLWARQPTALPAYRWSDREPRPWRGAASVGCPGSSGAVRLSDARSSQSSLATVPPP